MCRRIPGSIDAESELPVGKVESRIIIDSTHLGRYMGIPDLLVEAPAKETNDATGGTTESGISGNKGLVFTGTPKAAGFDERVSISVDLSVAGPDRTTLVFTPTGVLTGAGTADQEVPEDKTAAVLAGVHQHDARAETAVRSGSDQRGCPWIGRHHRGHRRGSNRLAG